MIFMGMYDDVKEGVSENIEIMGMPFYAENITSDEPYNRRERVFNSISGGTEWVSQGKYIHRKFNFSTSIYFPTGQPEVYDNIFKEMLSKPVEVVSKYMGNFNALVTIHKNIPESSPNHMDLDVDLVEIPDVKSNIPGESFIVPKVKKITTSTKVKSKTKNSNVSDKIIVNSKSKNKSVKKKNK